MRRLLFQTILGAATLGLGLGFAAYLDWRLELLSHFRAYALLGIVLGVGGLLALEADRRLRLAHAGVLTAALFALGMLVAVGLPPADARPPRTISVLAYNVFHRNADLDAVLQVIRTSEADLVALAEVSPALRARLAELRDLYPQQRVGRFGNAGAVAILSRAPIETAYQDQLSRDGRTGLFARVATSIGRLWFVAVHPQSPIASAENAASRDAYLRTLGRRVARLDGPVIVAGDFNTTVFSPAFTRLARTAGLAGGTAWWATTFPSWLPPGIGIAIDHVLVSRDLTVDAPTALDAGGSDHRPIRTRVARRGIGIPDAHAVAGNATGG